VEPGTTHMWGDGKQGAGKPCMMGEGGVEPGTAKMWGDGKQGAGKPFRTGHSMRMSMSKRGWWAVFGAQTKVGRGRGDRQSTVRSTPAIPLTRHAPAAPAHRAGLCKGTTTSDRDAAQGRVGRAKHPPAPAAPCTCNPLHQAHAHMGNNPVTTLLTSPPAWGSIVRRASPPPPNPPAPTPTHPHIPPAPTHPPTPHSTGPTSHLRNSSATTASFCTGSKAQVEYTSKPSSWLNTSRGRV
jgi:hypothetical protein